MTVKEKVQFRGARRTMLATLYGRALDSGLESPVLGDQTAAATLENIDCDFAGLGMDVEMAMLISGRARRIDDWAADFLSRTPDATVVHMGCGMDTRVFRLQPPASVRWFDVDYPDVIALRQRLYADMAAKLPCYETIGTSVTDESWFDRLPARSPALVIAEGLLMYLEPAEGEALLRNLAARFTHGSMIFDVLNKRAIQLQAWNPVVRHAAADMRWGIDEPEVFERLGLEVEEFLDSYDSLTQLNVIERLSGRTRLKMRLGRALPPLERRSYLARLRF